MQSSKSTSKQTGKIEESPLLTTPPKQKPPSANSTINIDKLDKSRFSEMKDVDGNENSSLRIIIYVLIVIVIGVGLALLGRQLISNQQNTNTGEQNPTSSPVSDSAFILNTSTMPDASATNVGANEDYTDDTLASLGSTSVDMETAKLDTIEYTDYETFSRLEFGITTTEAKLPKTNLTYDPAKMSLTVEVVGLANFDSDLQEDLTVGSLVTEVRYDTVNKKYIIFLSEKSKYRVVAEGDNLVIDFKTLTELEKPVEETPATDDDTDTDTDTDEDTDTDTSTDDGTKPAAPHYTNTFSQSTQYVSSDVDSKSISLNNYYVWDEGTFFEFSWAQEKKLGEDYIPNAKAFLEEEDGTNFLVVEIDNLKAANLADGLTADQVAAKAGITMSGSNFVEIKRDSFDTTTGKAVYKIELKNKANFQLLTQTTYDEKTQILSVQIKD